MAAPHRRRARRAATIVATVVASVTTCLSATAQPVPAGTTAAPGSTPPARSTAVPPGEYRVTLITGDRIALTVDLAGRIESSVEHWASWPGRSAEQRVNGSSGPDGVFVIPEDVQSAVDAGWLDKSLFDVGYLAAHGLHDAKTSTLPVLMEYAGQAVPRGSARTQDAALLATAEAAPASTATAALSSIDAAAVAVDKAQAATFWQALGRSRTARSATAVEKVWLDRPVSVTLTDSVPLIGAPSAWAAGLDGAGTTVAVLDTGIDENHPDLRGSVVTAKSFVGGEVRDGHGHGTHVAATVAGRGQVKGVAPAAKLAIGKVLSDAGSGAMSGIIDGMEWATQEAGADVVSMSLGGDPTDGTDPGSQAVNALTASTGALFVIAAGNSGPADRTVAAPGAADAALTVGATDKQDGLAKFTSRGPRIDGALKPDISAPGVAIVAARAAGTSLGTPVDDLYTSLSGTSMATPHVAGAAAILKQRHPDWTPERLKAALMSTSTEAGGPNAYFRGAGRLDVARAVTQQVFATTANGDFGPVEEGTSEPQTRQVEFRNAGTAPVTLSLTAALRTKDGDPVGAAALTTDPEVTVPAGGTATATVTLNVSGLARATYSGTVGATAGEIRVRVPVGVIVELPGATLTVRTLDRGGNPIGDLPIANGGSLDGYAPWASTVTAMNVPGVSTVTDRTTAGPGVEVFRVKHGSYNLRRAIRWWDDSVERYVNMYLQDAQVDVTGDTEIVLDARQAVPITWSLPKAGTAGLDTIVTVDLGTADRGILSSWGTYTFMTPTEKVTATTFTVGVKLERFANTQLSMSVKGPDPMPVPVTQRCHADSGLALCENSGGEPTTAGGWVPFPAGRRTLQLVDAGFGDPADLAGLDLRGKLALIRWGDRRLYPDIPSSTIWTDRIDNLQRAGAIGFVAYADPQGEQYARHTSFTTPTEFVFHWPDAGPKQIRIPEIQVLRATGKKLAALTRRGPVTVEVNSDPTVRWAYHPHVFYRQQVPGSLHHKLTDRDFTRVDTTLHDPTGAPQRASSSPVSFTPGTTWGMGVTSLLTTSRAGLTEFYGPFEADVVWKRSLLVFTPDGTSRAVPEPRTFTRPDRITENLNAGPYLPGPFELRTVGAKEPSSIPLSGFVGCMMCREGDSLVPVRGRVNGQGEGGGGLAPAMRMSAADGTAIPMTQRGGVPVFQLPATGGRFTATLAESNQRTTWTFWSERPAQSTVPPGTFCVGRQLGGWTDPCAAQPLIYPIYDFSGVQKLDTTVPATVPVLNFRVRVAPGQSTTAMPKIAGLKLWTSVDGGAHWRPAVVVPHGGYHGGERWFGVISLHGGRPGAKLSLKSEAWDAAGDRVEQVVKDAVTLS